MDSHIEEHYCYDCGIDVNPVPDVNTEPKDEQCSVSGSYHGFVNGRCVYCLAYANQ